MDESAMEDVNALIQDVANQVITNDASEMWGKTTLVI